jgi:phospholipid/cholesterol/gamma-HCH transport system substrate-binding protein
MSLLRGSGPEVMARLSALALAAILVVSITGYAALHYGWFSQGPEYRAEFQDAWPLVPGMDVRVSGAVVGSVRNVQLTDHGTALVTFQLRPGVLAPRADASVAIRQDDLLGDSDLSLELGTANAPLRGPIPLSRSIQEPRLDDFLDIFHAPVRAALQTFIVEVGTAMEDRGADVNRAILDLRPGFLALGNVLEQVTGQISALRQGLANAHRVTAQLSQNSGDLGRLVLGLQRTISGVAAQSSALNAGLSRLPQTLAETDTTLRRVSSLSDAVTPLADTVSAAAPGFAHVAGLLGPYAAALGTASRLASPTVTDAGATLRGGAPALDALHRVKVSDLLDPAGGLFAALGPVFNQGATALFGTPSGVGGLGGATFPGNDVTAPLVDPARDYLGAYLVVGCNLFGVPDTPGCLSRILSTYLGQRSSTAAPHPGSAAPAVLATPPAASSRPAGAPAPQRPSPPSTTTTTAPAAAAPVTGLAGQVKSLLGYLLKR